ncbi:MAG: ribonuclease [Bryobacterales bacterium]|nr:ribonuclease [Bryobacterales bacterium]
MMASLLRHNRRSVNQIFATVLVAAMVSVGSGACQGRQRGQRHEKGQAGRFDSYVLALSWAPAFCAQEDSNRSSRECDARRHVGFVVHGLWPQGSEGAPLEYCRGVPPVSHAIVEDMLKIMPERSLIQHEWRAHGSCSGLSARDYFAAVKKAYSRVAVPQQFGYHGRRIDAKPADVEQLFQAAGSLGDAAGVRVACRGGELTEVRICLSRSLEPIPCSNNLRECPASRVLVRPIP